MLCAEHLPEPLLEVLLVLPLTLMFLTDVICEGMVEKMKGKNLCDLQETRSLCQGVLSHKVKGSRM